MMNISIQSFPEIYRNAVVKIMSIFYQFQQHFDLISYHLIDISFRTTIA